MAFASIPVHTALIVNIIDNILAVTCLKSHGEYIPSWYKDPEGLDMDREGVIGDYSGENIRCPLRMFFIWTFQTITTCSKAHIIGYVPK
jgi:hypothetical protein